MDLQEYQYVYNDYKHELKEFPPLQHLLKSMEKTTKKLECLNLYSAADRRQFDLENQQKVIMDDMAKLYKHISTIQFRISNNQICEQQIEGIGSELDRIKQKNIEIFDLLNKQEELLGKEIDLAQYYLGDQQKQNEGFGQKIKEEDQFDEEIMRGSDPNEGLEPQQLSEDVQVRIEKLRQEIDGIGKKILKLNNGKGKWLNTDHQDFVRIYNKCQGNSKKTIDEGIKILGMTNIEIIDHLELYQEYLQLEKQKKLIAEEYKQIKLLRQISEQEEGEQLQKTKQMKQKQRKQKQIQQQIRKKQMVQQYKQKKAHDKVRMLEQQQKKQEEIQKKAKVPLPSTKKRQIIERNKRFIEEKQKTFKERNSSITKEQPKISTNKILKTSANKIQPPNKTVAQSITKNKS